MNAAYDPDGKTDFAKILTFVNTDKVWAEPARFTATSFVAKGAPAYLYLFPMSARTTDQRKTRLDVIEKVATSTKSN